MRPALIDPLRIVYVPGLGIGRPADKRASHVLPHFTLGAAKGSGMAGLRDGIQWGAIEHSRSGDHKRLIKLLRSDELLNREVREYIASQLERPPKSKFARISKVDLSVRDRDRWLFYRIARAKLEIAALKIFPEKEGTPDWLEPYILGEVQSAELEAIRWDDVTNRAALDWLQDRGFEYHDEHLTNAMTRRRHENLDWDQFLKQRPLLNFVY